MSNRKMIVGALLLLLTGMLLGFFAAKPQEMGVGHEGDTHGHEAEEVEVEEGPHGGRMLEDGSFAIELVIFEQGAAPEFRAYPYRDGEALSPADVTLEARLDRLGGETDQLAFAPGSEFLRSVSDVHEPHSFDVTVTAEHAGERHRWQYESHEGRTAITAAAAEAAGVETAVAGPASIRDTVTLYGTVRANEERVYAVTARFGGIVREVRARVGDQVEEGDTLAIVENNDSLQRYAVQAPADGKILARSANAGDPADGTLFTLVDLSEVWVDFAAFPHERRRLAEGQTVRVGDADGVHAAATLLTYVAPVGSPASQSMLARTVLPNPEGHWAPGLLVTGEVTVSRREVPLAVQRDAMQAFRERTVVFAKFGNVYEVRMLDVGAGDEDHVEVLDGIKPGTEYVTANSYLIKADLLKSGAAHAH